MNVCLSGAQEMPILTCHLCKDHRGDHTLCGLSLLDVRKSFPLPSVEANDEGRF